MINPKTYALYHDILEFIEFSMNKYKEDEQFVMNAMDDYLELMALEGIAEAKAQLRLIKQEGENGNAD